MKRGSFNALFVKAQLRLEDFGNERYTKNSEGWIYNAVCFYGLNEKQLYNYIEKSILPFMERRPASEIVVEISKLKEEKDGEKKKSE